MRIHALAAGDALRRVTGRAVTLGVTRHARVQVALGFPRVVARGARPHGPDVRRRMETPTLRPIAARRVASDADPPVAVAAERLLRVAARAARIVLARSLRVHREP